MSEKIRKSKEKNKGSRNSSIEKEVLGNRKNKTHEDIEIDVISPKKKLFNSKINNLKVKYKKDKKKFLLLLSSLLLVLSLICGTSYAYLTYVGKTDNTTKIKVGTLAMTLKNESNEIILDGAEPQQDEEALENNKEYEFTIENQGSLDSIYKIKLDNLCTLEGTFSIGGENITPDKCIPNEYIKVGLKKTDNTYKEGILKGTPEVNGAVLNSDGMEFDGSSYIDMGNANYEFGSSITIAARVKFNDIPTSAYSIINNAEVAGFAFGKNKNNKLEFLAYSSTDSNYKYAISTTTVEPNKWYTVVGTYDGAKVKIYVNGVKEAETPLTDEMTISPMPIFIGANPQPNGEHLYKLNGTISDALVMNDVLTEEEIAKNYSSQINYYDNDKTLFYQNWNEKVYSDYEVLEYNEDDNSYILDQNVLKPNDERSYKMKLWLDYDTPNDYNAQNMYNIIYSGALAIDYEQTKYKEVDVSYRVSFNANGGTGEIATQTFAAGDKKALSKNTFTKEGYTFVGWSTSTNGIVKYSDEEVVSNLANVENKVVKLYAVWASNPQTINVSVMTNDTVDIVRLVEYGQNANITLDAAGYNNPLVTCTNNISAGVRNNILKVSNVISDTTCEVEYTPNTYTIEYNLNGGEAGDSLPTEATYDEEVTISNPSKIGYGFAGWTSENIDEKTAYYGETRWTDGSTKVASETFKNLTSQNNGKVILKANWDNNVYTVKYDANTGTGTEMEESYHSYGISSALHKNTYIKEGYNFIGWSKDKNATTATYKDEASILNIASEGEKEVTLYAVWKLKEKNITINMTYDTSTFSGPSTTYQTSEYQYLSKTSTKLKYGEEETITSSPAYPDDRYTGSVACTNGIATSLTEGEGTTTREDTIVISNNSDTNTDSVCTITYTPKWEGIAYGTYSGTTTYAGKTWTVKTDNGENTGLVLNGNAGSGAYKADVQSNLANTVVNTDVTGGGIKAQSSGIYVTTDSGISTNYSSVGQVYWSESGKVITNVDINKYTPGTVYTWSSGHKTYSIKDSADETTTYWRVTSFTTSYTSEPAYAAGASVSATNTSSTVTFTNGTLSSTNQGYMSARYFALEPNESKKDASSKILPMRRYAKDRVDDSYILESGYINDTKTWKLYDCGNTYHGQAYTFTAVDGTQFRYTSQTGASLTPAYGNYRWYWSAYASSTTTGTANSNLVRTYRFDQHGSCAERTSYTVSNLTKTIYYRPYLIVRER